jgi:RND superfamily putative drug exporter
VGVAAAAFSGPASSSFSIPGTESQGAIDLLKKEFPEAASDSATTRIVFDPPAGHAVTEPAMRSLIDAVVAEAGKTADVKKVTIPFYPSQDGDVALAQIEHDSPPGAISPEVQQSLKDSAQPALNAGFEVNFGGTGMDASPTGQTSELIGLGVAALVLSLTFGSLIAAGLPLLNALVGVGIGISGISAATGFIELNATAPILATMLGLAVAIDYALLIASRYRDELAAGRSLAEAAAQANGTAGSAVVFAGLTVVIALAGLSVVGIPFLTAMGISAAIAVVISVLIAVTLLPAMFGFAGDRLRPRSGKHSHSNVTMGHRWILGVTRRPLLMLIVGVLGLGTVALPAGALRLGIADQGMLPADSTQRKAYDALSDAYGAGFNGPLTVVVDAKRGTADSTVTGVVADLSDTAGVVSVGKPTYNGSHSTAVLTVIPDEGPSSEDTKGLLHDIRENMTAADADVLITGNTAMNIDITAKLAQALPVYLLVVVGLAFVLLTLIFRSMLVPITATLGFLLTIAASFGAVVAVFQWGWLSDLIGLEEGGPVSALLPILLIGILFGLAMDYQVFLTLRMREEFSRGSEPITSVITGFKHGARVITAAAIIMISVFAAFMVTDDVMVKSIGFALSFGVLVDAFIVRMILVPSAMTLMGSKAWWLPKSLDNLLPGMDVEGDKLHKQPDLVS